MHVISILSHFYLALIKSLISPENNDRLFPNPPCNICTDMQSLLCLIVICLNLQQGGDASLFLHSEMLFFFICKNAFHLPSCSPSSCVTNPPAPATVVLSYSPVSQCCFIQSPASVMWDQLFITGCQLWLCHLMVPHQHTDLEWKGINKRLENGSGFIPGNVSVGDPAYPHQTHISASSNN